MYKTKVYNNLELSNVEFFENGYVKSGFPQKEYTFINQYGKFQAQHRNDEARKQTINSLEFFENGNIRKISLQKREYIVTKLGTLPAEMILFYESEKLRKIFPLNGRITGYWSEKDEYNLAEKFEVNIGKNKLINKFINLEFFENGNIKSLLLWPGEIANINILGKNIKVKSSISFYESGNIKSIEPAESIILNTPVGEVNILNSSESSGLGNNYSISFYENGNIKKVKTSTDKFEILKDEKIVEIIEPRLKPSMCSDKIMIPEAIDIKFYKDRINFNNEKDFSLKSHKFIVYNKVTKPINISYCS